MWHGFCGIADFSNRLIHITKIRLIHITKINNCSSDTEIKNMWCGF